MNVCILSPYRTVPVIDGAARRVAEIAAGLANEGLFVTLLHAGASDSTLKKRNIQMIGFPSLENSTITKTFLWSHALDAYFSWGNFALYRTLLHVLRSKKIDILQIEGPWSIFTAELTTRFSSRPAIVHDVHNVEISATRFSSSIHWLWPYVGFLENMAANQPDAIFCVSELDRARMRNLYRTQSSKIFVVPNGVHSARYEIDTGMKIRKRLSLQMDSKIVFFHGQLLWKPNAEAAFTIVESIAPCFEETTPETIFLIAGSNPSRNLLNRARTRSNVKVLGFIPKIEEYICAADVCIAPMKTGSGTKLKILEYLAAGKTVVATRKAVEGLGIRNGIEAHIYDNVDDDYVSGIEVALCSGNNSESIKRAKSFARLYDWPIIVKKIVRVYDKILDQRRS